MMIKKQKVAFMRLAQLEFLTLRKLIQIPADLRSALKGFRVFNTAILWLNVLLCQIHIGQSTILAMLFQ